MMKLQPKYFPLETLVLMTSSSGYPLSICKCSFTFSWFYLSPKRKKINRREHVRYQGSTGNSIYDFSKCSYVGLKILDRRCTLLF